MLFAQASTFSGPPVDWFALTPLLILTGGALVVMVGGALMDRLLPKGAYAIFTAAVAIAALAVTFVLWHQVMDDGPKQVMGDAIVLDGPGLFITVVIVGSILLSSLFLDDYLRREGLEGAETYALIIVSAIGGLWRLRRVAAVRPLATAALSATVAMLVAGMSEYNFGDSEFLMLLLVLITLPYAAARTRQGQAQPV